MSDWVSTRAENPSGPLNTGSGDQYIYFTAGAQLQDPERPTFRRVADDQLSWLHRVLVAPAGMGDARSKLADTGTVILDGSAGSGRTSAARVLLRECHQDSGVFHELLPDEEGVSLKDPELVGAGDRLLLDLSAADDAQWAAARADLSALRKAVHEQHAHLVVVMRHRSTLDSDLQHYRVELQRPPGRQVFRRHLKEHGVPHEEYLQPEPAVLREFLHEDRPMREIADFADRVRRARTTARPGGSFAQWCATARKAGDDRRAEVATLVAGLREAPQRALLITVAMLHGAHADVIHDAADLLLRTLNSPAEESPLLQRKDLAERLTEISAHTGVYGHVHFDDLDHDAAIRAHFWDHLPDLRQHLATWAVRAVELTGPHVTSTLRDQLVAQLAGQYLRTGRGDGLASLAEDWSATSTSRARLEAAVHALTCGLNDPAQGRSFRVRIYQWCFARQLRGEFAQVLIQVCADVIAASHPDQALVRLYHLARRERDTTRALTALRELVATSGRLRRRLLGRLADSRLSPTELRIFLRICEPLALTGPQDNSRALVEEHGVQHSLTRCWCAVLDRLPSAVWQPYAERWLHAAGDTEHRGDLLLDLLVGAADRRTDRRGTTFAALYASARAAERTAPGGPTRAAATTELLLQKISAAQGLGPPTSPPPTTPPRGVL